MQGFAILNADHAIMRVGGTFQGSAKFHKFTTYLSANIAVKALPPGSYYIASQDAVRAKPEDYHK